MIFYRPKFLLVMTLLCGGCHFLPAQELGAERITKATIEKARNPLLYARTAKKMTVQKSDFETNQQFMERLTKGAQPCTFLIPIQYTASTADRDTHSPSFFYSIVDNGFIVYEPALRITVASNKKIVGSYTGTNAYGAKAKIIKTFAEESYFGFETLNERKVKLEYQPRLESLTIRYLIDSFYSLIPMDAVKAQKKLHSYAFLVQGSVFGVKESTDHSSPTITEPEDLVSKKYGIIMDPAVTTVSLVDMDSKEVKTTIRFAIAQ